MLLPQPVSPTMPSVSPCSTSNETPSTAFTAPIWRWKITPRLIGKCLTRSRTSIRASSLARLRSGRSGRRAAALELVVGVAVARGGSSSTSTRCAPAGAVASPRDRHAGVRLGRGGGHPPANRVAAGLDAVPDLRCAPRARAGTPTMWPAPPSTGASCGSTRLWASRTYGQRGWKWQPLGRWIRLGGRPEIGTSSSSRGLSRRGIELQQTPGVRMLRDCGRSRR